VRTVELNLQLAWWRDNSITVYPNKFIDRQENLRPFTAVASVTFHRTSTAQLILGSLAVTADIVVMKPEGSG